MSDESQGAKPLSRRYNLVVVVLLAVVYTFNFLDRNLLANLSEPIRRELNLSYTQIGLLTGLTFALFYTTFGIPIAWLADRTNRVRMIAAALSIWSLFSMGCGLASSFALLALARIGVGVGEAGGGPASLSLLSDYFPARQRGTAIAIYSMGAPVGSALAAAAGAGIAAVYGWRAAFLLVGLPGVLLALIVLVVIREPRRGRLDAHGDGQAAISPSRPLVQSLIAYFSNPVLVMTGVAAGLAVFVSQGFAMNAVAYLISNRGMKLTQIATFYSVTQAVAGGIGMFAGGWLSDRLSRFSPAAYALVPAAALAINAPFLLAYLWAPSWQIALMFMSVPIALNAVFQAPALAVVQNAVPAGQRGMAGSILLFLMGIIGYGGGPLYVGLIADHFKPVYGTTALRFGLAALAPVALVALVAHLVSARLMQRAFDPADKA